MPAEPGFTVRSEIDRPSGETLLIGLPHPGMASLTATDYLVTNHDSEYVGHVATRGLPSLTPFEEGKPRHHTRIFDVHEADLTVVSGEFFVPAFAAEAFVDGLLEWAGPDAVDEIVLLHGIPYPHGPDEHEVFYVASPSYDDGRLAERDIEPLHGGMLDGVAGELMTRSMEGSSASVVAFVTPSHPPGPDIDAATNLLDAIELVYDVPIDRQRLEEIRARWRRYYAELADRIDTLAESDEPVASYSYPEDRAYM